MNSGAPMRWNIRYDTDRNFVHVHQGGRFSVDREAAFFNAIFESPFWQSGMPLVINFSEMEMDNIDDSVVSNVRRLLTLLNRRLGNGRFALVCDDEYKYGFGLKFQALLAVDIDADLGVFLDENEAIDWVTSSKESEVIT